MALSWSWACIEGPIEKPFKCRHGKHQGICTVTEVLIDSESGDPTSKVRKVELGTHEFLTKVTIRDNLAEDTVFPHSFDHKKALSIRDRGYTIDGASEWLVTSFYSSLDTGVKSDITDGYFLFIEFCEPDSDMEGSISGLLL